MKKRSVVLFVVLFATLLVGSLPSSQAANSVSCAWIDHDVPGPPARHSPAMAYDSRRQVVVFFGGITGRERDGLLFGDTWEWDGTSWKQVATTGPTPRLGHAMVYDAARGVVVLFGGNDGTFRNETWEWDGVEWRKVADTGPSPRSRFGLAYDERRGVVVLFGGIPRDTADTWEWDGREWKRIETALAPSGRLRVAMAYDPTRQAVVLFGGRLPDGQPAGDTWAWDGTTWEELAPAGDDARARHGMVYVPNLGALLSIGVAFGGSSRTVVFADEGWEPVAVVEAGRDDGQGDVIDEGRRATGAAGSRQSGGGAAAQRSSRSLGPVPRVYYGLVYDAARGSILLFGGWDGNAPLGDTWELRCEG